MQDNVFIGCELGDGVRISAAAAKMFNQLGMVAPASSHHFGTDKRASPDRGGHNLKKLVREKLVRPLRVQIGSRRQLRPADRRPREYETPRSCNTKIWATSGENRAERSRQTGGATQPAALTRVRAARALPPPIPDEKIGAAPATPEVLD